MTPQMPGEGPLPEDGWDDAAHGTAQDIPLQDDTPQRPPTGTTAEDARLWVANNIAKAARAKREEYLELVGYSKGVEDVAKFFGSGSARMPKALLDLMGAEV